MPKLCYRSGGTTYKYDLKDNVTSSPKLAIRSGNTTKYLGLKQGTKTGELHVRFNSKTYYVQTIVPFDDSTPVTATDLTFYSAQSVADGYAWVTNDTLNNQALCRMYGLTYGQDGIPIADMANYGINWRTYEPWTKDAHNYCSNQWGGTGPHRMQAKDTEGNVLEDHPYYHEVTRPFYFAYSDNNLKFYTAVNDRAADILLYDVLKNGQSTRSLRETTTPIMFEPGDTMAVIVYFGGYNTRSNFPFVITYNPTIRYAD